MAKPSEECSVGGELETPSTHAGTPDNLVKLELESSHLFP